MSRFVLATICGGSWKSHSPFFGCLESNISHKPPPRMSSSLQCGPLPVLNGVITPINGPMNGQQGVITLLIGVITLLTTGRGPPYIGFITCVSAPKVALIHDQINPEIWNKSRNRLVLWNDMIYEYNLGVAPSHDASDHQDYYTFRIGDPELNLRFPLASWEGTIPKISSFVLLNLCIIYIHTLYIIIITLHP